MRKIISALEKIDYFTNNFSIYPIDFISKFPILSFLALKADNKIGYKSFFTAEVNIQYWYKIQSETMSFSLLNVEKFLFCLKLEIGGIILGWFRGVLSVIGLLLTFLSFGMVIFNYSAFLNSTTLNDEQKHSIEHLKYRKKIIDIEWKDFFLILCFRSNNANFILVCRIFCICFLCLRSADKRREKCKRLKQLVINYLNVINCYQLFLNFQRSSRQVRPYLILIGFETVLVLLPILQFTWTAFIQGIFGAVVMGYLFICIYSMWEMFRDEKMRGNNKEYRQATMMDKV